MAEGDFFDVMKQTVNAMAPGLKNFAPDIKKELSRLRTQGAMELAHALFNGSAFTPYGPGQYPPKVELVNGGKEQAAQEMEPQQERDLGGREM